MKVKELIKVLNECNPEATVIVNGQEDIVTSFGKKIPIEENKAGKENCDIVSFSNMGKIDETRKKELTEKLINLYKKK